MDLFLLQFLRDDHTVGSELNIFKRTLEKMMIDVARQLMPVIMEPMIRGVVKEELVLAMEKVLPTMKMNSDSRASTTESTSLQLRFISKINPVVWTGKKNEENPLIEVALVDGRTGEVVKSGPEAEAKVEIVALKGGFDGIGEGDSWTSEEFNDKIIRECKGKKSILRGKTYLKLKEGKGFSSDISFTHNKDWMNIHELRLGAKIVDSVFKTTIKEAKTESFILKDLRNSKNKKHYPPLSSDEVWRIERIQKNGSYHKRLTKANINTVMDFLTLLSINPKKLQNILEIRANPKIWKAMVDHAETCLVNEGLYRYSDSSYEQKTEVVFNAHGKLKGLIIESQYVPVDQLSEDKKADGQKSVKSASEHWPDVVSLKDESSLRNASIQSATTVKSFSSLTGESTAGSNYRIPPLASDQGSTSCSNCRIPPLDSNQERPNSPNSINPPLYSDQGRQISYNCVNPSLVNDPECPAGTPPLTDNHPQPSSSSLVITHSFDPSGSANNFQSWPSFDNTENHIFKYQSHDLPIPSPENNEELLQSWYSGHNLQQEIPNVEMNPEQQGSACDILMTSQEVCMDQNQNIICKMVRSLSIRIGATEPEGIHVEKKQRGC